MMKDISKTLLCALLFYSIPAVAMMKSPTSGRYKYSVDTTLDIYQTTQNFDNNGELVDLGSSRSYEKNNLEFFGKYRINKHLTAYGELNLASGKSVGLSETRTNSQITDLVVGGSYKIKNWLPFFQLKYPKSTLDQNTDKLILSEGSLDLEPGLFYKFDFLNLEWNLKSSFAIRSEKRSHLFNYAAGVKKQFSSLSLNIALEGSRSISDDGELNSPNTKTTVTDRVNAGSYRYYSVNPELTTLNLWLGYGLNKNYSFYGGLKSDILGKNQASGMSYYIGLSWNGSRIGKKRKRKAFKPSDESKELKQQDYFDIDPEIKEEKQR